MKRRLVLLEKNVFWLFVAAALVMFFALLAAPQYRLMKSLAREVDTTRTQCRQIARCIRDARADAAAMQHSAYFVEKTARMDLGLRRPGEREMILAVRGPRTPFTLPRPEPPNALERCLAPFSEEPLFRAAVLLSAISMLFVAFISIDKPIPPEGKGARKKGTGVFCS